MKLPSGGRALVPHEKVERYLLDPEHPEGGDKALFFHRMGYDPARPADLISDLRRIAREGSLAETIRTEHGTKHIVDGVVSTPDGRRIELRTVWIVEPGSRRPRLVTAYPQ